MPTLLPTKVKALAKKHPADAITDWMGIWSISLGCAAATFAMFVYFSADDQLAATFVLSAAAFMIFLASHAGGSQHDR
ncbi:MAG: hypothetical protein ACRECC_14270 [Pseudolabrys sp.]|jgi:hypothetical protein